MNTSHSVGAAHAPPEQPMGQKRLEKYLEPELQKLTQRAELFQKWANRWYLFALCLGLLTLFRSVALSVLIPNLTTPIHEPTWLDFVRNTASSLIVVGLLSAMVRFAYVMGKSCMVESIRNNNRRHAIEFGKFYLEAFGDKVQWSEVKDALSSWNIDIGSSFLTQSPGDVDPQGFLQSIATILSAMGKKVGEKE
jgi:hypothetical protein